MAPPPGEPEPEVDPRRKNPDEQPARGPVRMPVVDDGTSQKDVISRLLQDRIILLGQGVDDEIANVLVAQLLYLANEDPTKDITLYINSPGGSVSAGMAFMIPCNTFPVMYLRYALVWRHPWVPSSWGLVHPGNDVPYPMHVL